MGQVLLLRQGMFFSRPERGRILKIVHRTVWDWGCISYHSGGETNIPVQVNDLSGVKAIADGINENYRMALKEDGTVWTWGRDSYPGNINSVPVQIIGISGITKVVAGSDHILAIKQQSSVL